MYDLSKIKLAANSIRKNIILMLGEAGSGHSASALGLADVFACLYFYLLNHNPQKPDWHQRDRLILSSGHACPVWYASLAEAGYFPKKELKTLRKFSSRLQGHPHKGLLPGIENTAGSIGQGLSLAIGQAIAFKIDNKKNQIICVCSDGEQQEGQAWEAYLLANKYELDNLIFLLDSNQIQIDGRIKNILDLSPLKNKLKSFGLHVLQADGHNPKDFIDTFLKMKTVQNQAKLILLNTIAGKGVDFMEDNFAWHGKVPNKQESQEALKQLDS